MRCPICQGKMTLQLGESDRYTKVYRCDDRNCKHEHREYRGV